MLLKEAGEATKKHRAVGASHAEDEALAAARKLAAAEGEIRLRDIAGLRATNFERDRARRPGDAGRIDQRRVEAPGVRSDRR